MFIYKITNLINGKCYIGLDSKEKEKETRWNQHKKAASGKYILQSKSKFIPALRKHGIENFSYEVLEEHDTIENLYNAEIKWIKYFDSQLNGYNIMSGGRRGHSTEWRKDPEKVKEFNRKQKENQPTDLHSSRVKQEWQNMPIDNKNKKLSGIRNFIKSLTPEEKEEKARQGGMGYARKYLLINPNGKSFKIISTVGKGGLKDFCSHHNLNFHYINDMLSGTIRDLNGWKCFNLDKKTEDIIPIIEYRKPYERKNAK